MPYTLFRNYFPEVADRETRSITVLPDSGGGLPEGEYGFVELYCDERGCDCRRVLFSVIRRSHQGIQAVIAWGWEDFDFYAKWFQSDDADAIAELKGPILNAGSPATKLAPRPGRTRPRRAADRPRVRRTDQKALQNVQRQGRSAADTPENPKISTTPETQNKETPVRKNGVSSA